MKIVRKVTFGQCATKRRVDKHNRRSQESGTELEGTIETAGVFQRIDEDLQAVDSRLEEARKKPKSERGLNSTIWMYNIENA